MESIVRLPWTKTWDNLLLGYNFPGLIRKAVDHILKSSQSQKRWRILEVRGAHYLDKMPVGLSSADAKGQGLGNRARTVG
jgi:hypothetical protein